MRRPSPTTIAGLAVGIGCLATWQAMKARTPLAPIEQSHPPPPLGKGAEEAPSDGGKASDRLAGRSLQLPSGLPAGLSCRDVRRVIAQARLHLAADPERLDVRAVADATVDWLDPHGFWSASPDAPLSAFLRKHAREFVRELELPSEKGGCPIAEEAGAIMAGWMAALANVFDDAAQHAEALAPGAAFQLAIEPAFEDRGVARPGRDLAHSLGRVVGVVGRSFGAQLSPFVHAAKERFLPPLTPPAWSEAILAAAVRAYVPLMDPHGSWAPLDEETSLYEVDLEAEPPPRLWDRRFRTALGVKVESGAAAPIEAGDLVLGVAGVPTVGLSVEQIDQLGVFDSVDPEESRRVVVLRDGETTLRALGVTAPPEPDHGHGEGGMLSTDWVRYGDADALVVTISDVPDDLGDLLASTMTRARAERTPAGVILDLRGNGGGSTDGANEALGLFLPGVRLFPMKRRDGVIETERAPEPPESDRWTGPVATLVDGESASAAEMIAGALGAYRRGVVAGSRTYGKGCAQEYLDDEVHVGVLRLTTLIFALPDGAPVQRVGILPGIYLGPGVVTERESKIAHALPSWRGPDVRDPQRAFDVPWPAHHGRVGPCRDDAVCRTLRALGVPRAPVARGRRPVSP
ncbi:MAG TPA: S41 family peptidase [Polyangiaceae bacterium]|nr:S41 family peptidase [Polyangiaceae bacterium]